MRAMALLLCISTLLVAGCARLNWFKRSESRSAPDSGLCVGTPAPPLEGVDFNGQPFKLSEQKGKVVAVVFWASGCIPCRQMIPHERALAANHQNQPFELVSVNLDNNPEAARKVMLAEQMTWPCIRAGDCNNPAGQQWKVKSIPAIYVIDPKGIIRYADVRGQSLDHAVETLLAEMAAKQKKS